MLQISQRQVARSGEWLRRSRKGKAEPYSFLLPAPPQKICVTRELLCLSFLIFQIFVQEWSPLSHGHALWICLLRLTLALPSPGVPPPSDVTLSVPHLRLPTCDPGPAPAWSRSWLRPPLSIRPFPGVPLASPTLASLAGAAPWRVANEESLLIVAARGFYPD